MWTESSWAFPELHYGIVRSSDGGQPGDKRAHNSTTKVSFCTIIIRLCHRLIAITRVQSESFGAFRASCEVIYIIYVRLDYKCHRTPGSRSYSDLLDTLADLVCIHLLVLKRRSKR